MRPSRTFLLSLAAVLGVSYPLGTANAGVTVIPFSYTAPGYSGSGDFYVADPPYTPYKQYQLAHVTGAFADSHVDSGQALITGGVLYGAWDNLLFYPAEPFVDSKGIGFSTEPTGSPSDQNAYVIYHNSVKGYEISYVYNYNEYTNHTLSAGVPLTSFIVNGVNAVADPPAAPEPATWAMMAIGFASLGLLAYRGNRRRRFAEAMGELSSAG